MISERKPGIYIPTLYFAEGLPYTIVMMMSGVFFKSLGASNVFVGLTSFLYLPWTLKFIWAPLVDFYGTKRAWIVVAQLALAALTVGLGMLAAFSTGMQFDKFVGGAVIVLSLIAVASATQDVAIDGYYLDVLDESQRAFFVGVRNAAYKIAWLFGSGAMVYLAGKLGETHGVGYGWHISFVICGVAMLLLSGLHAWYLPRPERMTEGEAASPAETATPSAQEVVSPAVSPAVSAADKNRLNFLQVIFTYFQQPRIGAIVFYILVFRFGDALMLKQAPLFLMDPASSGGLGISLADIGIINGTVGVIALLLGGIVGSWLLSRGGLKRWMWPFALIQNSAILLYFVLAAWPHLFASTHVITTNAVSHAPNPYLAAVYIVNSIEQFSYGLGVAAYTVFLLTTVRTEYKAANYATATALMALGVMIPGAISGYLTKLGYAEFFLISFLASLPGILAIFFLPIWHGDGTPSSADPKGLADGQRPLIEPAAGDESDGISQTGQVGSEGK